MKAFREGDENPVPIPALSNIGIGEESFEHANVLSEKNNFSAPGGRKVPIFGMEDLDRQYFDVSNFSDPPDPPYMSKNANMCYF